MISTGQAGELASRLLWLLAKDILVRAEDKNLQVSPQLCSKGLGRGTYRLQNGSAFHIPGILVWETILAS